MKNNLNKLLENQIVESVFLRDKPLKILMGLKTSRKSVYVTMLSKEANCTYSHTIKILNLFKGMKIVDFEKKGRIKKVTLTSQGWEIATQMETLLKKFNGLQELSLREKNNKKKTRK